MFPTRPQTLFAIGMASLLFASSAALARNCDDNIAHAPKKAYRGYVGDEFPQFYNEAGEFHYRAAPLSALGSDNGDTPLEFLRIQFWRDDVALFKKILNDQLKILIALPKVKLRVVYREEDFVSITQIMNGLAPELRARIDFISVSGVELLRPWARDPSLLLSDGKTLLLSRARMMGATSEEQDGGMSETAIDDYYEAVTKYATKAGLTVRTSNFRFEGGNVLTGAKNVFVGQDTVKAAMEDFNISEEKAVEALSLEFGKPVVVIRGEFDQPQEHIDLMMAVLRNHKTGEEVIAIESPRLGRQLLGTVKTGWVSEKASEIVIKMRRYLNGNDYMAAVLEADLEDIARELSKTYRVVRVPGISVKDFINPGPLLNFTNVIASEKTLLVPEFGIPALDDEAKRIYASLGYAVVPMLASSETFVHSGGPRCLTETGRLHP